MVRKPLRIRLFGLKIFRKFGRLQFEWKIKFAKHIRNI